jgi:hypothetical protein
MSHRYPLLVEARVKEEKNSNPKYFVVMVWPNLFERPIATNRQRDSDNQIENMPNPWYFTQK